MGQKSNPNILRLGKTKNWKSKYIENNNREVALYNFQDLQIKTFINKFLKDNNLNLHTCKIYYYETSLHIFISYYLTNEAYLQFNNIKKNNVFKLNRESNASQKKIQIKNKKLKKSIFNYLNYSKFYFKKSLNKFIGENLFTNNKNNYFLKSIVNEKKLKKIRRIRLINYYKAFLLNQTVTNIEGILKNSFLEKINENISLFTKKKNDIHINFHQLNKDAKINLLKPEKLYLRKKIIQLRKFNKNKFFKKGLHTMFNCLTSNQSAEFLAKFIANELNKHKRHHFFINFIHKTLNTLNKKKICAPKNIQIQIKGRFNGAPRSKKRVIKIGNNIPFITLNANIDYCEETCFSSNGTFSIKVWIQKNNK